MDTRLLRLRQMDRATQAEDWRANPPPRGGWIRNIRTALGMTTEQLARRLGVQQPRAVKIEQAEPDGAITIRQMRKVAEALGCEFHYALIPKRPLSETVDAQATAAATATARTIAHTMALEDQRPDEAFVREQVETAKRELLAGRWSRLWD